MSIDTKRRALAQARRMPVWQRLIDSIHLAQTRAGYDGRHFGPEEMRHFGATLIGKPAENVGTTPADFAAYWIERQALTHSDGSASVSYVLKAVYGDNLADVHTISRADMLDPSPEAEAATALDYVRRAHSQAGGRA